MEPIVIRLQYPIDDIEEITFPARIKAKHLKGMPSSFYDKAGEGLTMEEILPLIANLSGLSNEQVGEIDAVDLMIIGEKLVPFLEGLFQSQEPSKK